MRRNAAITSPQVSSAVAYDGRPGPVREHTRMPRRVHASTSIWGNTPPWLMSRSLTSFSISGARIGVRSRISARASVSLSRAASASTSFVWSFQMVTLWPATLEKHASVRIVSW